MPKGIPGSGLAHLPNAERQRIKRRADPEKWNAARREWHLNNLEKSRAVKRDWYARNKDRLRDYFRAQWKAKDTRRRAAAGTVTALEVRQILESQRGRCAVCRTKVGDSYHVDHIEPLAKGGGNDRRNIQILCPTCNLSKGAKDPATFMRSRGFLL